MEMLFKMFLNNLKSNQI